MYNLLVIMDLCLCMSEEARSFLKNTGSAMTRIGIFILCNIFLLYIAIAVNVWLGFMLLGMFALAVFAAVYGERNKPTYTRTRK